MLKEEYTTRVLPFIRLRISRRVVLLAGTLNLVYGWI